MPNTPRKNIQQALYSAGFINTLATNAITTGTSFYTISNNTSVVIPGKKQRKKRKPSTRPGPKTVAKVVAWLESMDLNVYGPLVNLETGEQMNALMDYDIEAIEKLAKHIKNGTFDPYLNQID